MFPRIAYLHWIEGRPEAATYDLATTNLRLGDPLERLEDRPDAPEGTPLPALLAAALGVDADRVLVTAGTTHANFLAIAAALDGARSAVLVESPGYEPLWATSDGLGATVRRFDRRADDGFALGPERVAGHLDDETALVAVTDRHNPSGRRADRERLEAVAAVVDDAGARLLVDEIYAPYDVGSPDEPQFGAGTAAGVPGTVVTGGLTKFFGLGDLRIGWLVADPMFVERAREVSAHVPAVSAVSRRLAARLLAVPDDEVERARVRAIENAARLEAFVASRADLEADVFDACPFALVSHERVDGDAVASAAWEAGVLVVPGRFYGAPERFRLAAAGPPPQTAAALDAFGDVLDAL